MKRVVILTKNTIDSDQRTLTEAKWLSKAKLSVTLIGLQRNQDSSFQTKEGLELIRVKTTFQLVYQFKQKLYPFFKKRNLINQYNFLLSLIKNLDQALKPLAIYTNLFLKLWQQKADYYHCHFPLVLLILTFIASQLKSGQFIFDYNNIVAKEGDFSYDTLSSQATYYQQDHLWGKALSYKEKIRLEETIAYLPQDINSILDLGCGDGRLTNQLTRLYPNVIGIDNSSVALGYVEGERILASSTAIPFPDSSFDLVISTELIEHLEPKDYKKTILEIKRVAKDWILLGVPWKEQLAIGKAYCANCHIYFHTNYHFRCFNEAKLSRLFSPEFNKVKSKEIGTQKRYYSSLLLFIKQRLGGIWMRTSTTVCPNCSTRLGFTEYPEQNAISAYCDKKNNKIKQNKNLAKSHIIALYKKR